MPFIIGRQGNLVLVCLNGCTPDGNTKGHRQMVDNWDYDHPNSEQGERWPPPAPGQLPIPEQVTMHAVDGWNSLMVAYPPPPPNPALPPGIQPPGGGVQFSQTVGAPVRLYICSVCGYVELYAGIIVDPATWGD